MKRMTEKLPLGLHILPTFLLNYWKIELLQRKTHNCHNLLGQRLPEANA